MNGSRIPIYSLSGVLSVNDEKNVGIGQGKRDVSLFVKIGMLEGHFANESSVRVVVQDLLQKICGIIGSERG